jgi:hypothetical protein
MFNLDKASFISEVKIDFVDFIGEEEDSIEITNILESFKRKADEEIRGIIRQCSSGSLKKLKVLSDSSKSANDTTLSSQSSNSMRNI